MDKLGEALVILYTKAEENDSTICLAFTPYGDNCMVDDYIDGVFPCSKCSFSNHRLLDKSVILLSKLED